ncbi:hypothetical protein [Legionella cincinnatiensis]|uniref:Uncharacterized protein n=1 Tax=Legionella cincinnatiensis TaxID=28085 RepID=A0A378IIK8_9GAMM|nr:hypothetical protein [Legionella cincinnatiensis]KTC93201.1 hypothetical protein Lcin_0239 [Legionella cincinnatiensis]STX35098.1 Uncharacterised protein [Legionella cincinnatiensis]
MKAYQIYHKKKAELDREFSPTSSETTYLILDNDIVTDQFPNYIAKFLFVKLKDVKTLLINKNYNAYVSTSTYFNRRMYA